MKGPNAKRGPATWSDTKRWAVASITLAVCLVVVVWLVVTDAPLVRYLVRLYQDKHFLKDTVRSWGVWAPLVFIAIQALQVIISPIPGEITGPVGGMLFGTLLGVIYSTIGLTAGTLICFALGRWWGEPLIRPWLSEHHWEKMNFIIEAEGAIICFILPTSAPTWATSSTSTPSPSSPSSPPSACRFTTTASASCRDSAAGKALDSGGAGSVACSARTWAPRSGGSASGFRTSPPSTFRRSVHRLSPERSGSRGRTERPRR